MTLVCLFLLLHDGGVEKEKEFVLCTTLWQTAKQHMINKAVEMLRCNLLDLRGRMG